jgi:alpha,alpha-trehalose phosphorylase
MNLLPDGHPPPPWCVRESGLDLGSLARSESVFALSNGHLGLRGNLDEGEPHGIPGTYLNSVYERRPLPYAEAGYGDPESGQTIINVTNGKLIRLLVDDEPFDVRYGSLIEHERVLDLRDGTLTRLARWRSPADATVLVRSRRLVSFTHRSVAAISYLVEAVDGPVRVVLQSELVANEQLPPAGLDPRAAAVLESPLVPVEHGVSGSRLKLLHRTRQSGIRVAAAADHEVVATSGVRMETSADVEDDWARFTVTAGLLPGQQLQLIKYLSYGWSQERSVPALRDQVAAGLVGARHTSWQGLCDDQRVYLDEFWHHADVEVDGDPELQQAVRFGLFHVLQSGARAEERPIAAKGLTGSGYDGHCFWDCETFVLPVLLHSAPHAVADALRWRHQTLDPARTRARTLGLRGAAFPWRTIDGAEASGYWPAGTAAFHINADIADAVVRYHLAVGDPQFEEEVGVELLVETARLWQSLGQDEAGAGFRIDGVTGPDEYSAVADNNVYTNLMAARNLRAAAAAVRDYPARARQLGVDPQESARWEASAASMVIPFNADLGVHEQSEGFTRHARLDLAAFGPDQYPLLFHVPYFQLYRTQVVKQADLVLAMFLCSKWFTAEQKAANFAYYEPLTVRDSSLSACVQAVIAAEVGHLDLAYDYVGEAALMDLQDLHHNVRDGLHIASLAGTWIALVCGLGGMRDDRDDITFAPRLPHGLTRLAFSVTHRGARLRVSTDGREATYLLSETSGSLTVVHHGEPLTLTAGLPVTRPVPPIDPGPAPAQPPGRAPMRRKPQP